MVSSAIDLSVTVRIQFAFCVRLSYSLINEPQRPKTFLLTYALSAVSEKIAHSRSLMRIFPERILDSQWCNINDYPDQIAQMRRLI